MNAKQIIPFLLSASWLLPAQAEPLSIDDSWVRASIPGQSRTAGYLTLGNTGAVDCTLLAANSELAGRVEIHEHRHSGGKMQMRQLPSLVIPAGGERRFEPGGLHLMLLELTRPLKPGEELAITFSTKECGEFSGVYAVKGIN